MNTSGLHGKLQRAILAFLLGCPNRTARLKEVAAAMSKQGLGGAYSNAATFKGLQSLCERGLVLRASHGGLRGVYSVCAGATLANLEGYVVIAEQSKGVVSAQGSNGLVDAVVAFRSRMGDELHLDTLMVWMCLRANAEAGMVTITAMEIGKRIGMPVLDVERHLTLLQSSGELSLVARTWKVY